jgi:erythromycin esterase-like protein
VNRWVKGRGDGGPAEEVLRAFDRWPTWMWANREVAELAEWLRAHNARQSAERAVGFYGLDVYSLWDSMRGVVEYLERVDPARRARRGARTPASTRTTTTSTSTRARRRSCRRRARTRR